MYKFLKDIFSNRKLLLSLVKNDFKQKYLGSYLGIAWAFLQPTFTILIFWFVFQVGFKSQPVDNFPFILWLIAGMIPWFFFAESLSNATNSIIENSYLVKKVVFRVSILPIVKISSALYVHLFFVVFMWGMFLFYGYNFEIYWLQIFYYMFATIILVLGLSWITSSLVVFSRDIGQLVSMCIQFGFWLTPVFWSLKMVPEKYIWIIELNPLVYIINGYRDSLIYHKWFWENINMTVYFWIITAIIFVLSSLVFRKLRPHFADVL